MSGKAAADEENPHSNSARAASARAPQARNTFRSMMSVLSRSGQRDPRVGGVQVACPRIPSRWPAQVRGIRPTRAARAGVADAHVNGGPHPVRECAATGDVPPHPTAWVIDDRHATPLRHGNFPQQGLAAGSGAPGRPRYRERPRSTCAPAVGSRTGPCIARDTVGAAA